MKLKYFSTIASAGAVFCLLTAGSAEAVKIQGSVGWGGNYVPVEADGVTVTTLGLADGLAFSSPAAMTNVTGDFTLLGSPGPLTPIAIDINSPFVFDPFVGGATGFSWGAPAGGGSPSAGFVLTSVNIVDQQANILALEGMGMLSLTGFDDTLGAFTLTANNNGASFTFSGTNAAVPDGGATLALLGVALLGLGAGRRLLRK